MSAFRAQFAGGGEVMAADQQTSRRRVALVLPDFQFLGNDVISGAVRFSRNSGQFEFRDVSYAPAVPTAEIGKRVWQLRPDGVILAMARSACRIPPGTRRISADGQHWRRSAR